MSKQSIAIPLGLMVMAMLGSCNRWSSAVGDPPAATPHSTVSPVLPTTLDPTATVSIPVSPTAPPGPTSPPFSPTPISPSPAPVNLFDYPSVRWFGRVSHHQGWVMADRLLWTDDAGASWSDITPVGLSNCPPPELCYLASLPAVQDAQRIRIAVIRGQESLPPTSLSFMFTDNGGRSWGLYPMAELDHSLECPGPACLSEADLEFADSENGWLAAFAPLGMSSDLQYLYRTRDGGRTWDSLTMPLAGQIVFQDALNGWMVGGESRWTSDQLLRTQDGGETWHSVALEIPPQHQEARREFQVPEFLTHDLGFLPVQFRPRDGKAGFALYVTRDGGEAWTLASLLEDHHLRRSERIPIPWAAIDASTWFVHASETRQYLTLDGGQTWAVFPAQGLSGAVVQEVQFTSRDLGWGLGLACAGGDGCTRPLFATYDGGRTWSPLAPAPLTRLEAVLGPTPPKQPGPPPDPRGQPSPWAGLRGPVQRSKAAARG